MVNVEEMFALAVRQHRAGHLAQAEQLYRQVVQFAPDHAAAYCNLGATLNQQSRPDEAIACYQMAIRANPRYADAYFNLGNALRKLGRFQDAVNSYQTALQFAPEHAGMHYNLGITWTNLGRWPEAYSCFERSLQLRPDFTEAYNHLGDCLQRMGRVDDAITCFRRLVEMQPDYPRGHHNLGLALASKGLYEEGIVHLKKAMELKPDYAEACNSIGVALEGLGKPDEALPYYQRAVQLRPDFADALNNLGVSYTEMGRHDEGIECRRMALSAYPQMAHVHSNMLLTMNYTMDISTEDLLVEHIDWAKQHAEPLKAQFTPRPVSWNPDKPLRIGYVSGDFRAHTVASFIEPLLRAHHRPEFHITSYANVGRLDETSERLRSLSDQWRVIIGQDDETVAAQIRKDEIDILVDLSGHTAGNRLLVFARKPAPIQMTMFGYPNTTGMKTIDYRVTDPISDPEGKTQRAYVESLLTLPEVAWVYQAPGDSPAVNDLPAMQNGYITFGMLNNPAKLTTRMIELWVKMMQSIPKSRLIALAGRNGFGAGYIRQRFQQAGLSADRLEIVPRLPARDYLALHQRVDVNLDPYPYNGGVTTCDSLWMGVPVLTLAGKTYISRQGISLMTHVGLKEFIAESPRDYVDVAMKLTNNVTKLSIIRRESRELLQKSPLMQYDRYITHLEAAYRRVWQERCATQEWSV